MKQVDLQGNVWDYNIGNVEPPISSFGSISYDELVKVMERFKKFPNFDELIKDNNKKDKEISRLNNIIDELEEYITSEYYTFDNESLEFEIAKNILDKLKELKEGK